MDLDEILYIDISSLFNVFHEIFIIYNKKMSCYVPLYKNANTYL